MLLTRLALQTLEFGKLDRRAPRLGIVVALAALLTDTPGLSLLSAQSYRDMHLQASPMVIDMLMGPCAVTNSRGHRPNFST